MNNLTCYPVEWEQPLVKLLVCWFKLLEGPNLLIVKVARGLRSDVNEIGALGARIKVFSLSIISPFFLEDAPTTAFPAPMLSRVCVLGENGFLVFEILAPRPKLHWAKHSASKTWMHKIISIDLIYTKLFQLKKKKITIWLYKFAAELKPIPFWSFMSTNSFNQALLWVESWKDTSCLSMPSTWSRYKQWLISYHYT